MNLLMISGDRTLLRPERGAFWYTLEELRKHFDRIDILCPKMRGTTGEPVAVFENVFVHSSPYNLSQQYYWIIERGLGLITQFKHAVMTVHEFPPFYNGWASRKLSRQTGVPFVLEIHHIVGFPKPASFSESIGYWMSRLYLRRDASHAAAVRCVSADTVRLLQKWGVHDCQVIPSFYLDRVLLTAERGTVKVHDVVACGRMVANKGFSGVIDAVAGLPGVTLLLIGDGPERKRLEARCREQKIWDRVTFTGWLPSNRDVYHALAQGRLFVLNSQSEGGPRVALEAMAVGLPVLTTKVGVMPEVIEDSKNGFFTTGKTDDLRAWIKTLLADPQSRESAGKEAQKILDRFDRETLVRKYAEFLQGVAKRP